MSARLRRRRRRTYGRQKATVTVTRTNRSTNQRKATRIRRKEPVYVAVKDKKTQRRRVIDVAKVQQLRAARRIAHRAEPPQRTKQAALLTRRKKNSSKAVFARNDSEGQTPLNSERGYKTVHSRGIHPRQGGAHCKQRPASDEKKHKRPGRGSGATERPRRFIPWCDAEKGSHNRRRK